MKTLRVSRTENGFLVEMNDDLHFASNKLWTFETSTSLAEFVSSWAIDHERLTKEPTNQQEHGKHHPF